MKPALNTFLLSNVLTNKQSFSETAADILTAAVTVQINTISSPAGLEAQPLVCFNEPIAPQSADKFSSEVHSDDKYPKRPLHHLAQRRLTFTAGAQKSLCTLPCPAEHTHHPVFSKGAGFLPRRRTMHGAGCSPAHRRVQGDTSQHAAAQARELFQ